MSATDLAIDLERVSLSLGHVPVLEDVTLALERGEFLGILGPNGAGKTLLLRVILGLVRPDRGTVRLLGQTPRRTRARAGYVPQYATFPRDFPIRVRDVVLMGRLGRARIGTRANGADREAAERALSEVQMTHQGERQIGELSGGQLQRVLIARALAQDPEILLLDEPTASLDPSVAGTLYTLLGEMRPARTIVMVAHDVGVVTRHVTEVACMNRRLFHHRAAALTPEMIEETYGHEMGVVLHEHPHGHAHGAPAHPGGAGGGR